jgi:diguanylate cyclase (GGDEF)-like protein/PAS domain S-box-containing protein
MSRYYFHASAFRAGRFDPDPAHTDRVHADRVWEEMACGGGGPMMPQWIWWALGSAVLLAGYQQFRIYRIGRDARRREELFQIIAENAADMIALVDMKGRRLYNSPAYKRILGYSPAELGETSAFEQIHPDDRFLVLEAAREARASGTGRRLEYRIKHKDGSWRVLESIASAIRDAKGEVTKLVIVNRDITERKRAQEQLEHNSFHDALTGLPNRRLFLDRLESSYARARRKAGHSYAVLLVDVDSFKDFNDKMSSRVGDLLLLEIGKRLAARLREDDAIARPDGDVAVAEAMLSRLGGDEFTILLEGIAEPSDALRVAKRIQAAVAEPFLLEEVEGKTSVSVGIAMSTAVHTQAEDVLRDAEVALRRAKALGGSHCELFDEAMHARAINRLKLEAELRTALGQHQFRVYYQPVIELETKEIAGFEALLRWHHPEQGVISPYKFLDAAEDTGLIISIGHWVLMQACGQLTAWGTGYSLAGRFHMAVNFSARQFIHAGLADDLRQAMQGTGIDPGRLQLEVAESVIATHAAVAAELLPQLKRLGVKVVLDNFGTGQSSLFQLGRLSIDGVKIGRKLVGGILTDRETRDIVELIITLAHKLNLQVTAEGVESAKQLECLRQLGCDLGQGRFFSQALDAAGAEKFLSESGSARASGAGAR